MTMSTMTKTTMRALALLAFGICLGLGLGCQDDGDSRATPSVPDAAAPGPSADRTDAGDGAAPASPTGGPLYATVDEVYTDTGSTSYVVLMNAPDVKQLDYSGAIEYSTGRATIGTVGGWLFVAGPEDPVVSRFAISAEGKVTKDLDISFANHGVKAADVSAWGNTFITATKAYLFGADGMVVIWNPTTMEITGTIPVPPQLLRSGKSVGYGQGIPRGNRFVRTIGWSDAMTYEPEPGQALVVYDLDTDTVLEVIEEIRCPEITNRVDADADGNLYFGNWFWSAGFALIGKTGKNCVLRMGPDQIHFDADWTFPYASVTEGRDGAMFSPYGNGKALMTVFYHERLPLLTDMTDPWKAAGSLNWKLWSIDLATRTGGPVEGLDWIIGGTSIFHLDGRTFVAIPMDGDTWATKFYEIKDGKAFPTFDARGWNFQLLKIR